jgi:hypothetical protein
MRRLLRDHRPSLTLTVTSDRTWSWILSTQLPPVHADMNCRMMAETIAGSVLCAK